MTSQPKNGHNERLNGNLKFINGSLADLEARFLQQRLCAIQSYLDDHLPDSDMVWNPLSWCRCLQLEPVRCEAEVLERLLHCPARQSTHLEEMLGDRLHQLDAQLVRLTYTHNYEETYWQTETERRVITKILHDWWHWLQVGDHG